MTGLIAPWKEYFSNPLNFLYLNVCTDFSLNSRIMFLRLFHQILHAAGKGIPCVVGWLQQYLPLCIRIPATR